jgi:hypothetical protein
MENKRVYTEKDFPIQTRMLYVWLPLLVTLFLAYVFEGWDRTVEPVFWVHIRSITGDLVALFAVSIMIGIFFWKRKGFIVDEEGIMVNNRLFGGTSQHILYAGIDRVYVKQDFVDNLLNVASVCIDTKQVSTTAHQNLQQFFPRRRYSECIAGLLPSDAEALRLVIDERMNNLTTENIIQREKQVTALTDGGNWLRAIMLTLFTPWILPTIFPWLAFSSDAKNIFFWFFPPLLTFLSFKYWRLFFSKEPKSPQLAYLIVYTSALLLVILVMSVI